MVKQNLVVCIMGQTERFINNENNQLYMVNKGGYKWGEREVNILCPCGNFFKTYQSQVNRGRKYCSLDCSSKYAKRTSWLKGKKMPKEIRKKLSISHKRAWAEGKMDNRKRLVGNLNHSKKPEVRQKISMANRGKGHWNWQGGITGKNYPPEWNIYLRELVKERDNFTCQNCGCKDKKLNVHHINHNKKDCSLNNLITWCTSCHTRHHNGRR